MAVDSSSFGGGGGCFVRYDSLDVKVFSTPPVVPCPTSLQVHPTMVPAGITTSHPSRSSHTGATQTEFMLLLGRILQIECLQNGLP